MEVGSKQNHVEKHDIPLADLHASKRTKTATGSHRDLEERLVATEELEVDDVAELLNLLSDKDLAWGDSPRRLRSAALFLTYVSRSSHTCCAQFVSLGGLILLGEVLCEAVAALENGVGLLRPGDLEEDTGMWALACLRCLRALPLRRVPIQEGIVSSLLRLQVLHPSVNAEEAAVGSITALSRSAKDLSQQLQCKGKLSPTLSTTLSPNLSPVLSPSLPPATTSSAVSVAASESLRSKARELLAQGLLGTAEGCALADKVEEALFSLHGGATPMYRQQARMLKSNLALAGNSELRSRLLSGSLPVDKLVAMDSTALAPEALQEERRLEQERAMRQTLITRMEPIPRSDGSRQPSTPARSDGERTPKPSV